MSIVFLWSPDCETGEAPPALAEALLREVPRLAWEAGGGIWADARGLPAHATAERLAAHVRAAGSAQADGAADARTSPAEASREDAPEPGTETSPERDVRVGVAAVPVVARVAARTAPDGVPVLVPAGEERAFLASLPVTVLEPEDATATLLEGVGLVTCGELAALPREAVEVRFGADGVRLWHLARSEDPRRLFAPIPPERPHAGIDFIDYVITDPARLLFTANALLGGVCERLAARGEHARRLALELPLGNGTVWRRVLRAARPTASRETWLRRIRLLLERLTVPDAVVGMRLEVEATEAAAVRQGDLFDRGFASAPAVEAAVARLAEERQALAVAPDTSAHPLLERRTRWVARAPLDVAETGRAEVAEMGGAHTMAPAALSLQLLPAPRRITVDAAPERDHLLPRRYRDRDGWRMLLEAAGPDRLSGGSWEEDPYAREYFRCLSEEGVLLWLYRDARRDEWFLHGWWD